MLKSVALIVNTNKKQAAAEAVKVIGWLQKKGLSVKIAKETASALNCDGEACTWRELIGGTDLVITLGGDGTVLKAVSLLQGKATPILAVNYGKFGFLQEVDPSNLYDDLKLVLEGKYFVEERDLLKISFNDKEYHALNDLVISHDGFRIMEIESFINGTFFYKYPADGIAVSTATGAAAYSLSAGGPFVNPKAKVNILTPLNPHSLVNRSVVLELADKVWLKTIGLDGRQKVLVDGMLIHHGAAITVNATGSDKKVKLVKLRPINFFGFLRKKLVDLCGVNGAG